MGSTLVNAFFLQILLTVLVPILGSNDLTDSDIKKIETGIQLGREIAVVIEKGNFHNVLKKVAANIGPYLGALGPAVSLALAFIPLKSEELEFLENLKKDIDIRFDRVDFRFDEIERKIDWSVVKVKFGQIEQNIRVMSEELADLWKVPKKGLKNRTIMFMNSYENIYDHSGTKLYYSVVYNQGIFQENIGQSVMRYTKNDRAETEAFLQGILRLIMEAIKIEITYLQVKGFKVNADHEQSEWQERIKILLKKFKEIDDSVTNAYYDQCLEDTKVIVNNNYALSNKDLSNLLYKELTRKYYWRDWMVLVYDPVGDSMNHGIKTCHGGTFFQLYGHNVVTGSVDKSNPILDLTRARQTLLGAAEFLRFYIPHYGFVSEEINPPDRILDSMDTSFACSIAIVRHFEWGWFPWSYNLHANFPETRGVRVQRSHYTMIMFG